MSTYTRIKTFFRVVVRRTKAKINCADVNLLPYRIIIFSDSQDCDFPNARVPKPYGKYNYIVDVSAEKRGVNYRGILDSRGEWV